MLPPELGPFGSLGLVDVNLQAKPALGAWDAEFAPRGAERAALRYQLAFWTA